MLKERYRDGELYKIINVVEHKTIKTGKPATVTFTNNEYIALSIYIGHLHTKMGQTSIDNVFLSFNTHHCDPAPLNFSSIYKILQKFQTQSEKTHHEHYVHLKLQNPEK